MHTPHISGVLEELSWGARNNSRSMKYKTGEDQVESVGKMAHNQNIKEIGSSLPLKFFFILLYLPLSPFFSLPPLSCVYFRHLSKGT